MRPARLAPLLLLPLLTAGLAGCTVLDDLGRLVDRAQGRVRYADVEVLNEEVAFGLNDTPAPPPAVGRATTLNFTVPADATALRVDVSVAFESPSGLPPLGGVPRGRVEVEVRSPARAEGNATFTETAVETFTTDAPPSGLWGVHAESVGQGRFRVVAVVTRPVA